MNGIGAEGGGCVCMKRNPCTAHTQKMASSWNNTLIQMLKYLSLVQLKSVEMEICGK